MSKLTRDGTAEPVSRDQILRHARGQGSIIFPVQLTTSRIDNLTRLIHTICYVLVRESILIFVGIWHCTECFFTTYRSPNVCVCVCVCVCVFFLVFLMCFLFCFALS